LPPPQSNASPEEAPEQEQHDDGSYPGNGTVLLEKQLPVDADSRALVLGRVLAQPAAHVAHLVQAVAAVEQVVDVLGHGLVHILELVVEAVHVVLRPAVLVEFLCALEEAFELGVGVRAQARVEVVFALVRALELLAHVVEIGEGEFLRVTAFGHGHEDEVVVHQVAAGGGQLVPNAFAAGCRPCYCGSL
jgi:hypothetical protein